ncbi:uncharacterized protein PV07_10724 [Cladophialophora immunda]|uniref:Uncharacterized protein n=1 Tax=Cladophialophora immunda TaxID=569365 RepID=A0A0D2AJL0_9EURO|nr:uncharacterized protein PV07_10724 [Cladophialophora immunda]KIW25052.1 hypothetical protein PV07_10724 [Cladophialophora immunda]OQU96564.1 hypothetical protein CLAIMM_02629 [Cladophialophora immunda]
MMERPAKRLKITNPDVRNPRDTGSRMTEGLFTSELGMQGDDTDLKVQPTRTISLSDFQRQNVFGSYEHAPRPMLPRRNAGIYLLPRAPDATVTASVVQVNVNDGTSTSKITEVTVATTGTVVSLSEVGTLTTAVSLTIPGISNSTSVKGSATDSSQQTITTPPITSGDTSTITSSTSISSPSNPANGTISSDTTSTGERTVTVTATSTFELSVINGTLIATDSRFDVNPTSRTNVGTTGISSSSTTVTFVFGDLTSTPTPSSDSLTSSDPSESLVTSSLSFTNGSGGGAAGSPTATTDSAATSSAGSGSGGGGGSSLTPTQQQVVGGVVGGVAGIALTLVIMLFLLRWYRRRLKARGQLPEQIAARELTGGGGGGGEAYPMSQRSSTTPLTAAVAHGLKRLRPRSSQTLGTTATGTTDSSVPESERGFQRIAGRKIAPVLSSGGDPYGGNFGAFEKDAGVGPSDMPRIPERGLSGASFYQDNRGFYGGKGTPTPPQVPSSPTTITTPAKTGDSSTPAGTASSARDFAETPRAPSVLNSSQISLNTPSRPEGFAIMRPSPARTPVTLSPAASSIRLPIQQPPSMAEDAPPLPPMLRDGVGRSLASQDGSRVSRSSGRSAGRFTENM